MQRSSAGAWNSTPTPLLGRPSTESFTGQEKGSAGTFSDTRQVTPEIPRAFLTPMVITPGLAGPARTQLIITSGAATTTTHLRPIPWETSAAVGPPRNSTP